MMHKSSIAHWLLILGIACLVLCTAVVVAVDVVAVHVMDREMKAYFDTNSSHIVRYDNIHLQLLRRRAEIHQIYFCSDTLDVEQVDQGRVEIGVESFFVEKIHYGPYLKNRKVSFDGARIVHPFVKVYYHNPDEGVAPSVPAKDLPVSRDQQLAVIAEQQQSLVQQAQVGMEVSQNMLRWIAALDVQYAQVENASVMLDNMDDAFHVQLDSADLMVYNMRYDWRDSLNAFAYNDSLYQLSARHLSVVMPDGLMKVEMRDFSTRNAGAVCFGQTHIWNCVPKKELALRQGRVATNWIDLRINSMHTSPVNIIRQALNQSIHIDSIFVQASRLELFRDQRFPEPKPSIMPQEALRLLTYPLMIRSVTLDMDTMHICLASTNHNIGQMDMRNLKVQLSEITNTPNRTIHTRLFGHIGKGTTQMNLDLHLDPACHWDMYLKAQNLSTTRLDNFMRPIVGMTTDCHITRLETRYHGDMKVAKGTFVMEYDHLQAEFHPEDKTPYPILTNNAKALTFFANHLVPKSNPRQPGKDPAAYSVMWKRDVTKPFPDYLFGPMVMGVVQTMLPGLFWVNRIESDPR